MTVDIVLRSDEVLNHLEAAQKTSVIKLFGKLVTLHDECFLPLVFA